MKPSDFTNYPYDSLLQKSECETIARNIMVILKRTSNEFRLLTWDDYRTERLKDGNFTDSERSYFNSVVEYCASAESAILFSPNWTAK